MAIEEPRTARGSLGSWIRMAGGCRLAWKWSGLVLLVGMGYLASRPWQGHAEAGATPGAAGLPTVAVSRVGREDLSREVTIPAEFRPYAEVELHAKVSGYLQQINVDIGDRVKAGQLMATLEVPELLDQLHNAIANQRRAEADYTNAHLACIRLQAVDKEHPNLVAQQDLDSAFAKDQAAAAAIAAGKADVEKYQTLVSYTRITAPFDGVITRRYADPGALIQAGTASGAQSMPLVRLSNNYRLRLDFPVSVDYVKDVHNGDVVDVRVQSMGDRKFPGSITRFSDKVDADTRTMPVEIEVPNSDLEIVPGMYASVKLKVERKPGALAIPITAVSGGSNPVVWVVTDSHEIQQCSVTLGLETPNRYEVLSGLHEGEMVVIGTPDRVKVGDKVTPKIVSLLAQQ